MWNERATLNICISLRYPIAVNFFTLSPQQLGMKYKKINAYIYTTLSYKCSCNMLTNTCLVLGKLFSKTVFMLPSTETSSYKEEMLG